MEKGKGELANGNNHRVAMEPVGRRGAQMLPRTSFIVN